LGSTPNHEGGSYDTWSIRDSKHRKWTIVRDSSIRCEYKINGRFIHTSNTLYSVELVTPKLRYDDIPTLQEAIRQIRKIGAKVNNSCGIHIHVDASNHTHRSLKNLLSIVYSKEDMLFKALQVNEYRAQAYCKKVREPVLQQIRSIPNSQDNLSQLQRVWYEGSDGSHSHYDQTRYYAVNLHSVFYKGTVEFRMFNSTLHAGRIKAYVHLALAISAQAITQRSSHMKKTTSENEAFTFRTWLLRLGMIGDEFKSTRDHLLANLDGSKAWRYDQDHYEKRHANRNQER
jgi:hypothetical protein